MDETSHSANEPLGTADLDQGPQLLDRAAEIAEIFAQVFERDSVGIDDDFFGLGGDSLMAATVMAAVEGRFKIALSISALLEAPTPRSLAEILPDIEAGGVVAALLEINGHGARPPIIYVHGSDGEFVLPPRFSNAIGNRSFYAFRAIGLEKGEVPFASIESTAGAYRNAVLSTCPSGPLVVLGHCAGSLIAYELAQNLRDAGRAPVGLILIDPPSHQSQVHLLSSGLERELKQASIRKDIARVEAYMRSHPQVSGQQRREMVKAMLEATAAAYTPKPYQGRTLLFVTPSARSALLDPKRGYPALLPDLEIVRLEVEHLQMFKDLKAIAKAINSFIDRLPM